MSVLSCLFGRDDALAALKSDPVCADRLHRFADGLLVVHLCGNIGLPWEDAESLASDPRGLPHWIDETWPPRSAIERWSASAHRLAWWWWWERGDALYADAVWLFGPDGSTLITRETYNLRETDTTFLHSGEERIELPASDPRARSSPYAIAMQHLGLGAKQQFFGPADDWHFDWAPFRVPRDI